MKRKRIRWSSSPYDPCDHSWTTGTGPDDPRDTGIHRCMKHVSHTKDITNDDHQCCCGNTTEEI